MPLLNEKAAQINIRALKRGTTLPANRYTQQHFFSYHFHTPEQNWTSNVASIPPGVFISGNGPDIGNLSVLLWRDTFAAGGASAVSEALKASRWILDLMDDWDEQGSPAYSEETWERVSEFLRKLNPDLPAPEIMPGPEGSIDVRWRMRSTELLANFPPDPSKPATFYGEGASSEHIEGNLDNAKSTAAVTAWLLG